MKIIVFNVKNDRKTQHNFIVKYSTVGGNHFWSDSDFLSKISDLICPFHIRSPSDWPPDQNLGGGSGGSPDSESDKI